MSKPKWKRKCRISAMSDTGLMASYHNIVNEMDRRGLAPVQKPRYVRFRFEVPVREPGLMVPSVLLENETLAGTVQIRPLARNIVELARALTRKVTKAHELGLRTHVKMFPTDGRPWNLHVRVEKVRTIPASTEVETLAETEE